MSKPYKYDIAISFAEEDDSLAEKLYEALTSYSHKFRTYYYKKKQGRQIGKRLPRVLRKVYMEESRYVVVLASKDYHKKEWTRREWDVIEEERENRQSLYRILISIDGTILDGMSKNELHIKSDMDAYEIASLIHETIDHNEKEQSNSNQRDSTKVERKGVVQVILSFLTSLTKAVIIKVLVSLITTVVIIAIATNPNWQYPGSSTPFSTDSTLITKPHSPEGTKTTSLMLTRSEHQADMFIYVGVKKVAVFDKYTVTIPDLKLGDEVSIGTNTNKEIVLIINQNHLENESFSYTLPD
ncbi:MAG: toll/interleukin-1 receptor domain-containing protein [Roseivirga sp.]|nr:toll/interleukin-1 receptor domain-containing protein [Roseivirga sp.]